MNFYQLTFKDTRGRTIPMENYRGKVVLVVNTATKCGFSSQLTALEDLHQRYANKGLVVLGFPCAQFLNQEPETNDSVVKACQINFGVTFLLSEKINVNGKNSHPVFRFLKQKLKGGFFSKAIKWNFTKFLIDADGIPYKRFAPSTKPAQLEKDINFLLSKI